MISIKGLNKGAVVAALYNASKPQGRGFLQYDPAPMTADEGQRYVREIDYLKGRVMKIDVTGDEFDEQWYDRDNGVGAAARALDALRNGDTR